jgi:hypothetical protein
VHATAAHREHGPVRVTAKQTSERDLQDVRPIPERDANVDTITIAKRARGNLVVREVDNDVDPLLFYPRAEILVKPDGSMRRTQPWRTP